MRLNIYDVSVLLAVDFEVAGIILKKSATQQEETRKGVFAGCLIKA